MNAWDVFAWFLNVSSSVVIVFINKVLLSEQNGHGFAFGELTADDAGPALAPARALTAC